jgi:hypothetical protein
VRHFYDEAITVLRTILVSHRQKRGIVLCGSEISGRSTAVCGLAKQLGIFLVVASPLQPALLRQILATAASGFWMLANDVDLWPMESLAWFENAIIDFYRAHHRGMFKTIYCNHSFVKVKRYSNYVVFKSPCIRCRPLF